MRDKIVELALSQVGIKEIPQNEVKYNTWYYGRKVNGSQYAWCAVFISWLANECKIMNKLIPSFSGCGTGVNWFKNRNLWLNGGNTPKKGYIIFFKPTIKGAISSHVGIVVDVKDGKVITVEGNKSNQVKKCTYSLGFNQILGYGTPNYDDETETAPVKPENPQYTGKITYQSYDAKKQKWLSEVNSRNTKDYAGNYNNAMSGLRAKCEYGNIYIQTRLLNGEWLEPISSSTYKKNSKDGNTYSGLIGKSIDAVKIWSDYGYVEYQVKLKNGKWLDYVDSRNVNKKDGSSYAGIYGSEIDAIRMK